MLDHAPPPAPLRESRPPAVPWRLGTSVSALLITFVSAVFGLSIVTAVSGDLFKHQQLTLNIVLYQWLVFGVVVSVFLLIVLRFHVGGSVLGYRFPGWGTLGTAAAAVLPVLLAVQLIGLFFNTFIPGYHLHGNAQELVQGEQPHLNLLGDVLVLAWVAVEVPLAEETLFRGILFQGLRETLVRWIPYHWAVFVGAVVSGLLFGLAHGEMYALPILAFLGIALAYVFQYSRSIFASAIVHGIINFLSTVTILHIV
jgi:membrane protease YdiL (CAAX protease family)